ncbi:phenylacetate--CoA ligase family protein [Sinomonas sp. JGH33]|uniref:Phenylacetate--CoA ligase family protein n=1 Tax=Sinomonas terricola TaxID=3110330 RepID=A0ABU5TBR5_9MICC|nr:phenylacetate--CoA ligase family protein [Sinomonas sp. JGH33]MEA5457119.1 phenylacetate--CoA ligase family protein [Sinomonas sp. JGH33]
MDLRMLASLLGTRALWRRRDHWGEPQIRDHQDRALAVLRGYAYARSAFYRRHHAGLQGAPLTELPPVTKAQLMESFDDVVTDPQVRLADVEAHLSELVRSEGDPGQPWRGRWWAAQTAGTTGRRGVFVWDRREWSTVLASYARANDWAEVPAGLTRPLSVAVVSSRLPTHQSAVVGATLDSRFVPTLRLDATAPRAETVAALNRFQPRLLVGYASALRPLAAEQQAGRLAIRPQRVVSASEVLAPSAAKEMEEAWGSAPLDVYAATETAGVASPCRYKNRHLYEDLLVLEPVDASGSPVPPGTVAAKLLVTVLFSRTIPLIRYELTDQLSVDGRECPCGRRFVQVSGVVGRLEDVLHLPGPSGTAEVHPNVFHAILDTAGATGWQVRQEADGLTVLLAGPPPDVALVALGRELEQALERAGAGETAVRWMVVEEIPRTALGKAPLVRALRPPSASPPMGSGTP